MDLLLPDIDGITVMKEAQRIAPAVDILIVTGHATLDSAVAAVEGGAAGYVRRLTRGAGAGRRRRRGIRPYNCR